MTYSECLRIIPRPCVDLVFRKGSKVLLCKRQIEPDRGKWCLVGGGIEVGEKPESAVIRKAKQELGVDVSKQPLRLIYIANYFHTMRHDICLTYALEWKNSYKITLDFQHSESKFYDINNLPNEIPEETKKQINAIREEI